VFNAKKHPLVKIDNSNSHPYMGLIEAYPQVENGQIALINGLS
jgi:hypothetical protein